MLRLRVLAYHVKVWLKEIAFLLQRLVSRTLAGRRVVVSWIDGGHFFSWYEPQIREALAPAKVVFQERAFRPHLLVGSMFGERFREPRNTPRILFCGESSLDEERLAAYDVAVHTVRECPGTIYVPFFVSSFGERRSNSPADLVKTPERIATALAMKSRFCAHLYRHDSQRRDELFDLLSTIAPVDALGSARNRNRPVVTDRWVYDAKRTYNDLAVEHYRPYRFAICGENNRLPGYVTEKIVSAMLAFAIPIYTGAPDIADHFNPASFLNADAMSSDELLERVRHLVSDESAYAAMLAEAWFHGNALPTAFEPNQELIRRIRALPIRRASQARTVQVTA